MPQQFSNLDVEHKKIIFYSRIDQWKGCELLINAFACIANKYPDWTVDVYGQCPDIYYYKKLNGLIDLYGIQKQFHLCGLARNKQTVFLRLRLLCIPIPF